jgi:hypothetical protein
MDIFDIDSPGLEPSPLPDALDAALPDSLIPDDSALNPHPDFGGLSQVHDVPGIDHHQTLLPHSDLTFSGGPGWKLQVESVPDLESGLDKIREMAIQRNEPGIVKAIDELKLDGIDKEGTLEIIDQAERAFGELAENDPARQFASPFNREPSIHALLKKMRIRFGGYES